MFADLLQLLGEILSTLITLALAPFALLYSWIIRPFINNSAQYGIVTAVLIFIGCALPIFFFVRSRVKLHQRKKYWRDRVNQDTPMTINEEKQMEADTRDPLAELLDSITFWPYRR